MTGSAASSRRGRPAAASREDVLGAAMHRYLRGERIDVQAIAAELRLGRATVYRWFGSREELIGEVLAAADGSADRRGARRRPRARRGRAARTPSTGSTAALMDAPALLQFVEQERDAALRIITSGAGIVQKHMVARVTGLIEDEVRAGTYEPPVEPETLGLCDRAAG